ncbi:glycosyltransferase [Sutcliffiella horikoshii]|uniref:glycosyltransferase n=1 Tax=Sutcliffiella horikoshii TaxID=79883 RepID=UPI003CEA66A5
MRVLFITSIYPSENKPAAGVFHQTQADSLKELGVKVDVVCPVPYTPKFLGVINKRYQEYLNQPLHYKWAGIDIYRPRFLAYPGQLKWSQPHKRFAKAVDRAIQENNLEFDVIHAHLAMPAGGAAAIIAKKYNKPYVLTLHGSDVNVYPHYSKGAMEAFRFAVRNAKEVIAVSGALAEETERLTGVKPRVLAIGINMERFEGADLDEQSKRAIRDKLGLPKDKKILLYIGRLVNEKGIRELVEAMKQLNDTFRLVLIGDGPLLQEVKVHPNIIVTGQIPNDCVKDYLLASDLFVLPSYNEGMPTVIIEALSLKVPVISSNVGGVPELFGEQKDLLIEPKSTKQIVEKVEQYSEGIIYTEEVRDSLYEKVKGKFDVKKNSLDLTFLYKQMQEKNPNNEVEK